MKRMFAVLLSVLLLMMAVPMGAIPVFAATSGTTGDCTWVLDGTHLTISGNGPMGDYGEWLGEQIPTPWGTDITAVTIEDGVTSIGDSAFDRCEALTTVTIPDSVTSIGYLAFYECTSLTSVIIPDGVTSIGHLAFYDCTSLASVTIGDSVTIIYDAAFMNCTSLTSVTIPGSVDETGYEAFMNCTSLTSVTISDGVTQVSAYAFYGCTSLTSVTIPDSVTVIEDLAFAHCTSLTSATVPNSVTVIGGGAFGECTSLTSITISNGVCSIDHGAFDYCTSLTDVYYSGSEADRTLIQIDSYNDPLLNATWHYNCSAGPSGVTSDGLKWILEGDTLTISGNGPLADYGDWGRSFTTLVIEEGVTSISRGENVLPLFYEHNNLTTVYIPKSVSFIERDSFRRCDSLTDVYYAGNRADRINMFAVPEHMEQYQYFEPLLMCEWHYGGSTSFGGTAGALTWVVEGEQLTISGNGAMDDYWSSGDVTSAPWGMDFKTVVIEEGVTSVGANAFCGNYHLQKVILPDSVTTIGDGAFGICQNLGEIHFGSGITTIGDGAFSICRSMGIVNIKDLAGWCNIEIVGGGFDDGGFDSCLFGWEGTLFLNGEMVTDLVIPDGVKTIKRMAFACSKIQSVTIPDSVTVVEEYAFACCWNITSITLPKSITTIDDAAFYECNSLADIHYGGNETNRENIYVGYVNDSLFAATWHYTEVPVEDGGYSDTVTHSVMDTDNGTGLAFRFTLRASGITMDENYVADYTNATIHHQGVEGKVIAAGAVLTNLADIGADEATMTLDSVDNDFVVDVPAMYLQETAEDYCAFAARIINIPAWALDQTVYARPYCVIEVGGEVITVYGDIDSAACADYL